MQPASTSARTAHLLAEHVKSQLLMYSVAAGAAGVGLLALTQPANGEIVYTPANVTIGVGILHSYALDLANNGVTDFSINASSRESIDTSGGTSRLIARGAAQGNAVVGYGRNALDLSAGQAIGRARRFNGFLMASLETFIGTSFHLRGRWPNVKNRYLGLQFQMDGETHYGWARLSVAVNRQSKRLTAVLTGYAYETIPNTPVLAGSTSGTVGARPAPASGLGISKTSRLSLGRLALGAQSISIWREEEKAAAA
jgi:hypothetical protein